MTKKQTIAIIGATGNVGREILNILTERDFPVEKIYAVASAKSVGKQVSFGDDTLNIMQIDDVDFSKVNIAFFCAGSNISKKYAKDAASNGCIVIDKSSFFRLDKDVPLIVPEANIGELKNFKHGIIANPNCCSIPLAVALKPLDNAAKIKRLVISTYQSVSGAGKAAMDELYNQTKAKFAFEDKEGKVFPRQMAFNLFPHIGDFKDNGQTEEEHKIEQELKKIVGNHIKPTVTCVRVPVFVSHSMSVNIEFENDINATEAEEILYEADGVIIYNHHNEHQYSDSTDAIGHDEVMVSRIRDDHSCSNSINLWITADNLRKGAALNAVQIAEEIIC